MLFYHCSNPVFFVSQIYPFLALLTGPHAFWPKRNYFGHKILMKPSHDCSYQPMGVRSNQTLLKETAIKAGEPLGEPRITEQQRRHGSSARCVRDPMTQAYWPGRRL